MRILLLGGRGQIGWELQHTLAPLGEVTAPSRDASDGGRFDLARLEQLRDAVRRLAPDVIVNAAGYTNVDEAEKAAESAARVNAEAVGVLAEEAARRDVMLVHYSTDYIFGGDGTRAWREEDEPAPLNVYGASKWQGEQAIRAAGARHLIFRTQWVYSARRRNFLLRMLELASERDALEVVDDQTGAPTSAGLIAEVTAEALAQAQARQHVSGTFHLAARGETTWHGFACFIVAEARRRGWPARLDEAAIVPVGTSAFPTVARRPHNSRLDVTKLERMFELRLPDWREGVAQVISTIASDRNGNAEAR